MNRKSTLIYQFNSLTNTVPLIFDFQELLRDDAKLKVKLKNFNRIVIKSPQIEILNPIRDI